MKYLIDTENQTLTVGDKEHALYSKEAFEILSKFWLKVGWNAHYHYTFSWLGRPILQLPEDIVRLQEVLWELKPDIIIETGVALGGSLLFYASLCALNGKGRVLGVDIDLRPPNQTELEKHSLAPYLTLIHGNSTDPTIFGKVRQCVMPDHTVFVILDSNHGRKHVLRELELYSQLVTPNSYLVVADGFMQELTDVPRGKEAWREDNPAVAVDEFLANHPDFVLEFPERRYNRSNIRENVSHFQNGWLKKI